MANIYIKIEHEYSPGVFTDVTRDVVEGSIRGTRGIQGSSPVDRVARTGVLTYDLLNNENNSAGLNGFYSPGHPDVRADFEVGIGARATLIINTEGWIEAGWVDPDWIDSEQAFPLWTGTIHKIEPQSGQFILPRFSRIQCRDYFEVLAQHRLQSSGVLQEISESDAFLSVITGLGKQPVALDVAAGVDTYRWFGDLSRDERTKPLEEIQRIGLSSYFTVFLRGDGTLVGEPRNVARAVFESPLTVIEALTESDIRAPERIRVEDNKTSIKNKVQVVFTPREVDGSIEVLYALRQGNTPFSPGETVITGLFTDPDERGLRTGGIDLIAPVAGTDFSWNSEPDGTGTDETANVTVTAVFRGNAVTLTIDNTTAFIVFPVTTGGAVQLQVRGVAVISKERIFIEEEDSASIADIGENALVIDMGYQSEIVVAQGLAEWFRDTLADEERKLRAIPLLMDPDDPDRAAVLAALQISDIITITETMTALGVTEKHFIQAVNFEVRRTGHVWLHHVTAPADEGPFIEFPDPAAPGAGLLTVGGAGGNSTTFTTASVSPTTDNLQLIWVAYGRLDSVNPVTPTITGVDLTWVEVATVLYHDTGTTRFQLTLFRALGIPTPGKDTITFGTAVDRCSWNWIQVPDVDTSGSSGSGAVVQSVTKTGSGTSVTATLAAFADGDNRPFVGAASIGAKVLDQEVGWTLLGRRTGSTPNVTAFKTSVDLTATILIPVSTNTLGIIAVEVEKV